MTTAHLAANYQLGQPAGDMIEVPTVVCECGIALDPVLGKVHQGTTVLWNVWISGNYEHRTRPATPHAPRPRVGPAASGGLSHD
jgi:hypothetical protein